MIKFALGCENDHEYEGWFSGGEEFDRLAKGGHLDCPVCGSRKISKLLMAPSIKTTKGKGSSPNRATYGGQESAPNASGGVPVAAAPDLPIGPSIPPEIREKVVEHLREIRKQVMANADNVGEKFTEEARKMHYGETKQRGIYGSATPQDAAELAEEGVEIMPLPVLPEDNN